MVSFELVKEDNEKALFRYYPEGDLKGFGLFILDKQTSITTLIELAEMDSIEEISVEELLSFRDAINEMRELNDRPLLTEEEYPIPTEPEIHIQYADHAMNHVLGAFSQGLVLERGQVHWY